jgi:hypothetical protein
MDAIMPDNPMPFPEAGRSQPVQLHSAPQKAGPAPRENVPTRVAGRTGEGEVSITRLNSILNRLMLPQDVNEPLIEEILGSLEGCDDDSLPRAQLLFARVLEALLVCTGHYVDNCEFSAAGDLLVNPRQILIHRKGHLHPLIKGRHLQLSAQLGSQAGSCQPFPLWFKHHAVLEISKPALLPCLLQRLENFQSFRPVYLGSIRRRMNKAADAMGFLAAWNLSGWEDLYARMQTASPQVRCFLNENLCRFDTKDFDRLGLDIDLISHEPDYRSSYMAH